MSNPVSSSFLDPRIWIKKLNTTIPYIKSESNSIKVYQEKTKSKGILARIRNAYYGRAKDEEKNSIQEKQPENKIKAVEMKPVIDKISLKSNGPIPVHKKPEDVNVTKDDATFLQNLDEVAKEFLNEGSGPAVMVTDNVTRNNASFHQNLDAISEAFFGEGSGPGVVINANVTRDDASFEENLVAATNAFLGKGPEKLEVQNENIVDLQKDIRENLDEIKSAFPNMSARQVPYVCTAKKPVNPRRIKGIHY